MPFIFFKALSIFFFCGILYTIVDKHVGGKGEITMRKEHDFLGDLEVPDEVYYGVQTMRAVENFNITGQKLDPDFIVALAKVKKAAAQANMETGRLDKCIGNAISLPGVYTEY